MNESRVGPLVNGGLVEGWDGWLDGRLHKGLDGVLDGKREGIRCNDGGLSRGGKGGNLKVREGRSGRRRSLCKAKVASRQTIM